MIAGPADEEDLRALAPAHDHPLGDRRHGQLLRAFRGDFARHEAEHRHRVLARRDDDLHRGFVHEHLVALPNPVHGRRQGTQAVGAVDERDAAVHLDLLDRQPLPAMAHVAFEVGGRVEVRREHAIARRRHPLCVVRHRVRAVLPHFLQDQVQHRLAFGTDDYLGVAGGLTRRADLEAGDLVVAAMQQDQIQHLRERARVDDVAVEVDGFGEHHVNCRLQIADCRLPVTTFVDHAVDPRNVVICNLQSAISNSSSSAVAVPPAPRARAAARGSAG